MIEILINRCRGVQRLSNSNGALVLSLKHNTGLESQKKVPPNKQSFSTDKSMKQPTCTTTTTNDKSLIVPKQFSCSSQALSKPSTSFHCSAKPNINMSLSSMQNTSMQLAQPNPAFKPVTKSLSLSTLKLKSPVASNPTNNSTLSLSLLANPGLCNEKDCDPPNPVLSKPKFNPQISQSVTYII